MAKATHEIEIKFAVADLKHLASLLRKNGFRLKTNRTQEYNVLYDSPGGELRARGELLRLRRYGKRWILTHKAKSAAGRHKRRVETETDVSDGQSLERMLLALGLEPSFRYEKFRTEWTDGKGDVVIDETPIGNIAEIEGPPRWIDQTAKKLGIGTRDYSTKSYADLFADWKKKTGSKAAHMLFAETSVARKD